MRRSVGYAFSAALVVLLGGLTGCGNSSSKDASSAAGELAFTDITDAAGLGGNVHETGALGKLWFPETNGGGLAFFDYDGDDWPDLLWVAGGTWHRHTDKRVNAIELFRNNHDGTFTRVTTNAGLDGIHVFPYGPSIADVDNDGDQDIFLATLERDLLLRNDNGRYTEVGLQIGLGNQAEWGSSAMFFDADNDGFPDLYVGNYVDWTEDSDRFCSMNGKSKAYCTPQAYRGVPGRYYHNNGDGTFTDRTEIAGFLTSPGKTLGVSEIDFNGDNYTDIVLANDTERACLYENNRDGTFTDRGVMAGIAFDDNGRAQAGMGVDAGDVDNSGEPSIVKGHFSNEMTGIWRHQGNGLFVDRAATSRVGQPAFMMLTFGLVLVDMDLDGLLDLFMSHGHIDSSIEAVQDGVHYRERQQLFLNRGEGAFQDVSMHLEPPFDRRMVARGVAYADIDRDGDLDVAIAENGGPLHLWRNDLKGGRSVRVYVTGTRSGTNGLGTTLVGYVGGTRITRRVRTGASYNSQSELPVTFGLGRASRLDSLVVRWTSGITERFGAIDAEAQVRIREGEGRFVLLEIED